jgi:putative nucleotidyltransferase with HDIG domain
MGRSNGLWERGSKKEEERQAKEAEPDQAAISADPIRPCRTETAHDMRKLHSLNRRIEDAMARLGGSEPDRDRPTLLVVDDEKGPRESLRMILSPQYRVLSATAADEAIDILEREPDVAVATIDLNMPGMKGDELMRIVRSRFPHVEVIVITGFQSVETAVQGIRHGVFDYLTKPFDVVEVGSAVRRAVDRRGSRRQLVSFLQGIGEALGRDRDPESALAALDVDLELRSRVQEALSQHAAVDERETSAFGQKRKDFLAALAEAIEGREPHTKGHARRVAYLADLIAQRMSLPDARCEELRVAAFLHDIGRIATPAGQETADLEERERPMESTRVHQELGAQLVAPLGYPPSVSEAILHHHDRWDGEGLPKGPQGDAIPLLSRILAAADEFDRLTHDHPHRMAMNTADAIQTLRKQAGSALDPAIVRVLVALAELGLCSVGPMGEMPFEPGSDPVDSIAQATAWLEMDR